MNRIEIYQINNKLSSFSKFSSYLIRSLDRNYFIKIGLFNFISISCFILLGSYRHGFTSYLVFLVVTLIFGPLLIVILFWTIYFHRQKNKFLEFEPNKLIIKKNNTINEIKYDSIWVIERNGNAMMCITTKSFKDIKIVGYNEAMYDEIIKLVLESGVRPVIRNNKGYV